jgi:hypothetical protein
MEDKEEVKSTREDKEVELQRINHTVENKDVKLWKTEIRWCEASKYKYEGEIIN